MDTKYNGMDWVGNLKQKVGAVFLEVDNIMSQDSVKFVGHQVQTVGKSMKRLYSGIVPDIRPPLVDPVKHQREGAAVSKSSDVSTNVDLKVGIQGSLIDEEDRLLHKVPVSAAKFTKDLDYPLKSNHFEAKANSQTFVNMIHGERSNLATGKSEMVLTSELIDRDNLSEMKASSSNASKLTAPDEQECVVSRLNTVDNEQLFGRSLGPECVSFDDKHRILRLEEIFAETSVCDREFSTQEKNMVGKIFMDDVGKPSDDSRVTTHLELNALTNSCAERMMEKALGSPVFYRNFPPEQKFTGQSCAEEVNHVSSDSKAYTPFGSNSTCEENIKGKGIDSSGFVCNIRTLKSNLTDESPSPTYFTSSSNQLNKTFSTALNDEDTVEKRVDLSSISLLEGPQAFVYSQKELVEKECKPIVEPGFVSDHVFTTYTPAPLLSIENVVHKSLVSENPHQESLAQEHEAVDVPLSGVSTDSADNISVSSMETIELSEKEKLESSCVIVDDTALYAVSSITRKKLSYKKMIQTAFTSKKRLAKEYEQLGIWFGDADIWPDQDPSGNLLPSATSGSKGINTDVTHDSEWEII